MTEGEGGQFWVKFACCIYECPLRSGLGTKNDKICISHPAVEDDVYSFNADYASDTGVHDTFTLCEKVCVLPYISPPAFFYSIPHSHNSVFD